MFTFGRSVRKLWIVFSMIFAILLAFDDKQLHDINRINVAFKMDNYDLVYVRNVMYVNWVL